MKFWGFMSLKIHNVRYLEEEKKKNLVPLYTKTKIYVYRLKEEWNELLHIRQSRVKNFYFSPKSI